MNQKPVKVVIAGAAGRMGRMLVRCSQRLPAIDIVGGTECAGHEHLGKDMGELAETESLGVTITNDLTPLLKDADVLIDFTLHDSVPLNVAAAALQRRAVVIGATGLNADETAAVQSTLDKIPIVWSPNMSLGVNVLFSVLKQYAPVFGSYYRVEIDETHHIHKKDAPSGTALRLGDKVAEALGKDFESIMIHDPDGASKIEDPQKIVIRSHREGEIVGDHTVSFICDGETVEFHHHAESREAFAMGALRAAEWVVSQRPGIYDMQDVLELSG